MPRKPRELVAGGIYHAYARGNDRQRIFADDADRRCYLALLQDVVARHAWHCLAYCLMTNHVHLLLETPQPDLGAGMQRLQGTYASRFNRRHKRTGHLFQGRYGAVRVEDDAHLWMTTAYIVHNPVDAGTCADPADWPWGSHAATLHDEPPRWLATDRLLTFLAAAGGGDGGDRYAELTRR